MSWLDLTNAQTTELKPLATGDYNVAVKEADLKDTASKTGQLIKVVFEILDGDFKGRKIFKNFNVLNKSAEAQAIGQSELKALMEASNAPSLVLHSPKDLLGLSCMAHVIPREYNGKVNGEISYFLKATTTPQPSTVTNVPNMAPGGFQ